MKSKNPFQKEQKLFSIISPCYKDDWKHLTKVANSLNEQEYRTFEWIVVFDGKNKRGDKEMKKLRSKYAWRIDYYTIEHAGAPAARNFGQTKAKGDFYVFLDSDKYLYSETLRMWSNAFENPKINRVWGLYDIITPDGPQGGFGTALTFPNGKVWYPSFKYSNYCDSTFPIRATAYIPWDESIKSLQDWDWAIRQLKRTDFRGDDFEYIPHSFFAGENVHEGGISQDSHRNWIERTNTVRNKNGIPKSDICVVSLGAAHHGYHIAEKLGADYLPMPSYKPHTYKLIYLIGFYTKEDPNNPITTRAHMMVFNDTQAKKVIHWIGTDVIHLRWNCSFEKIKAIKNWIKKEKIVNLSEIDFIQKELKEVGVKTKVVPIPPKELNDPMPLPKKFTVAIYDNSQNPMYNTVLMEAVVKAMPDIQFYFFGDEPSKGKKGKNFEYLGYVNMKDWMPKFSCNLRVSVHDGLPLLPIEFLTAGRQVVTNVNLKGVIKVEDNMKSIIEGIRKAQKSGLNPKWGRYWKRELNFNKYIKRIRKLI